MFYVTSVFLCSTLTIQSLINNGDYMYFGTQMITAPGSQSAVVDHNQLDQPPPPYHTTQPTRLHRNEMVSVSYFVIFTMSSSCTYVRPPYLDKSFTIFLKINFVYIAHQKPHLFLKCRLRISNTIYSRIYWWE